MEGQKAGNPINYTRTIQEVSRNCRRYTNVAKQNRPKKTLTNDEGMGCSRGRIVKALCLEASPDWLKEGGKRGKLRSLRKVGNLEEF